MLFCLSVNYTPKGLEAMGKNPKTNRREAVEKLLLPPAARWSPCTPQSRTDRARW